MRAEVSRLSMLESHFLNTFFSGVYLGASDMLHVAHSVGIALDMSSRELLIKELFKKSDELGLVAETFGAIKALIDERMAELQSLMQAYPATSETLKKLHSKADASKMLLSQQMRGNPYER